MNKDKIKTMIRETNTQRGNEIVQFAIKTLERYAIQESYAPRNTSDLSPLETWLILELHRAIHEPSGRRIPGSFGDKNPPNKME